MNLLSHSHPRVRSLHTLSLRVALAESPELSLFATLELLQEVASDHWGAEGVPVGPHALLLFIIPLAHGGGGGRSGRRQGGERRRGVGAQQGHGLGPARGGGGD